MPRVKGSSRFGPVRALRLPLALDAWFEQRLREEPQRTGSEMLVELLHAGLRTRGRYFERHVATVARLLRSGDSARTSAYLLALQDTFGDEYLRHICACAQESVSTAR